jgi:hypothetical protein
MAGVVSPPFSLPLEFGALGKKVPALVMEPIDGRIECAFLGLKSENLSCCCGVSTIILSPPIFA